MGGKCVSKMDIFQPAPDLELPQFNRVDSFRLHEALNSDYLVLVFYRTDACPVCHKYLTTLEESRADFAAVGAQLVAVTADDEQKARKTVEATRVTFPVAYNLTKEYASQYGLFWNEKGGHSEPGAFIIDRAGRVRYASIQSFPLGRPEPKDLIQLIHVFNRIGERDVGGSI
jgi:peroxiredoxin